MGFVVQLLEKGVEYTKRSSASSGLDDRIIRIEERAERDGDAWGLAADPLLGYDSERRHRRSHREKTDQ